MMKQKTFMMLKPDAFTNQYEEILKDLKAHGLKIEKQHRPDHPARGRLHTSRG